MALLSGLLYSLPYKNITEVKHSKHYHAQAKNPSDRSMFGYEAIKLEEEVIYFVGWREDDMNEYHANKGEYLVQAPTQPPKIVETWSELRTKYKIFKK